MRIPGLPFLPLNHFSRRFFGLFCQRQVRACKKNTDPDEPVFLIFKTSPASFAPYGSFSILIAQTLYSGIRAYLSRAALVRILASPSGKWNGIQVSPGDTLSLTRA